MFKGIADKQFEIPCYANQQNKHIIKIILRLFRKKGELRTWLSKIF